MTFDDFNLEFDFDSEEIKKEPYPDFYYSWDRALSGGNTPGFYEPNQLREIIEIYLHEDNLSKARKTIDIGLKRYEEDEDLLYEILVLLSDFELWNDLLALSNSYKLDSVFWIDGHKLEALLHLGMEEEAFEFFKETKETYADDEESLSVLYRAMGEALIGVDLFEAAILVINEAVETLGEDIEFLWLQMESYVALGLSDNVSETGSKIESITPFDALSWHRMGVLYKEIKEYDKAIEAFEFASNLDFPDKKKILFELLRVYEKNGNPEKALEKAKELLHLYPDSYFINLSAASLSADMENWEEAIKFLNNLIAEKPNLDALYIYKASYFMNMGEYKKAKLTLQEGIEKTNDPEGELDKQLKKINEQFPDV